MYDDGTCITAVTYKPRKSALFLIDNIIFVCDIKGIGNDVLNAFSEEIKSIFHNTFEENKLNMRYPLPSRNGHWFYTTEVANVTCISSEIQHLSILTNLQHVSVYIKQINCK